MTLAEMMLRVAVAVAGWLVFAAHGIALLAVSLSDGKFVSDSNRVATTALAAVAALALAGVGLGLPYRRKLRWAALLTLTPAIAAAGVLGSSDLGAHPPGWMAAQAGVLVLATIQAARFWRRRPEAEEDRPL